MLSYDFRCQGKRYKLWKNLIFNSATKNAASHRDSCQTAAAQRRKGSCKDRHPEDVAGLQLLQDT